MLEMKDIIFKFLSEIAEEIKKEQISQGRYASGRTAQSIEVSANDTSGVIEGNISALALETGRKPGSVPAQFRHTIKTWMDQKRLFQNETESKRNSIAYLISRKIAERGTLLYRQGGNSGVLSKAITPEKIRVFSDEVLSMYGREIRKEIVTSFGK